MKVDTLRGEHNKNQVTRACQLIGALRGQELLFNWPLAIDWPMHPNTGTVFAGQTAVRKMIDGGNPAIEFVRRNIEALVKWA